MNVSLNAAAADTVRGPIPDGATSEYITAITILRDIMKNSAMFNDKTNYELQVLGTIARDMTAESKKFLLTCANEHGTAESAALWSHMNNALSIAMPLYVTICACNK